ncbi:MAG: AGE family epimerase/isomerase [Phycisphaeraceae bacterium]
MGPDRLAELRNIYRDGLLNDTLAFWFPRCVDEKHGGYFTALDRDGTLIDDDKSVWVQGRAAWLLGTLYNIVEPREQWLDWARSGIEFLDRHCFDPADGRMWFHVTRDGRPIRKRRYAFSESFAAIAYGEYARATGSDEYAEKARRCFDAFVTHQGEPKFTDVRPMQGLGHPMIAIVTAQELRDSIGLADADAWIDRSIETIKRDHMKPDLQAVMETVGLGGEVLDHFDGRTLNPGHAIEAAWFIMREGQRRNDSQLIKTGLTILDWMWERGWDREHGGLLYFVDVFNKPVQEYWHDMKFWWPQNEAIIATLMAHQITGEQRYADWHRQAHDWAYKHFADAEYGEWFGYLHRDGTPSSTLKGNMWKGPFHLPRMQLTCMRLLTPDGQQVGS